MLTYYLHDEAKQIRLILAGTLAGQDVAELEGCWRTASSVAGPRGISVNVAQVTETDADGRALLEQMRSEGVEIAGKPAQHREARASFLSILWNVVTLRFDNSYF